MEKSDIDWDRVIRETDEIAEIIGFKREEETNSQPLFTLTAEEVEDLKMILKNRNESIYDILSIIFGDSLRNSKLIAEQNKILSILTRINQYQDELRRIL